MLPEDDTDMGAVRIPLGVLGNRGLLSVKQ